MDRRLNEAEIQAALDDRDGPNEPQDLPGEGLGGPRERVEPGVARTRRTAMSRLLASGASMDEITEVMTAQPTAAKPKNFGLSGRQIRQLVKEVHATWSTEDSERRPHDKAAAVRRLKGHIRDARKEKSFTAVAMFEKTLAMIEGTCEPIEIRHSGTVRIQEAILAVVGDMDEPALRQLVDEELRYMGADVRDPSRTLVVESEAVEVTAP